MIICEIIDTVFIVWQRIRSTVDEREQKQLLMDLDVVMRSSDCPYIVQFYGALFREVCSTAVLLEYVTRVFSQSASVFLSLSGGLLDMHGAHVYLLRQILQIRLFLFRWSDSRGDFRKNNISCESLFIPVWHYNKWWVHCWLMFFCVTVDCEST